VVSTTFMDSLSYRNHDLSLELVGYENFRTHKGRSAGYTVAINAAPVTYFERLFK